MISTQRYKFNDLISQEIRRVENASNWPIVILGMVKYDNSYVF